VPALLASDTAQPRLCSCCCLAHRAPQPGHRHTSAFTSCQSFALQVTELAALAGEPGLFGPPPPGGAPARHRAPLLPPAQQLGKRQTKRPASYAEAADLDSYLDGSGVRIRRVGS
jgi:hypothetical protein